MEAHKKIAIIGVAIIGLSSPASAEDVNVDFSGTILESCSLTLGGTGTLGPSSDLTVLSSEETGGVSGSVVASTNGVGSTIQVIAPTAFNTGPSSRDTNTVFAAAYELTGATIIGQVTGSTVTPLGLGQTTVTVDASATKSAGVFDAGTYTLTTVVRCTTT